MKFKALIFLIGLMILDGVWSDFSVWSADLKPGMVLTTIQRDGRTCHCKVPVNTTTTTIAPPASTSTTTPTTTSTTTTTTPTTTTTTTTTTPTTTTTTTPTTTTTTTPTTTTPATTTTTTPTTTTTTTPTTTSTTTTKAPTTTTTTSTTTTKVPTTTTSTTTTKATTTTTTTTKAPTTTTTTTTTTKPPASNYDYCNVKLTVTPTTNMHWMSPNYPANYPDGITCTLSITIPASMPYTVVTLTPSSKSYVYNDGPYCPYDQIQYTNSAGIMAKYCKTLSEISEMTYMDGPKTFSLKFVSTVADGGKTAAGFDYYIRVNSMLG